MTTETEIAWWIETNRLDRADSPLEVYGGVLFSTDTSGVQWFVGQHFAPLQIWRVDEGVSEMLVSEDEAHAYLKFVGEADVYIDCVATDGAGVLHAFARTGAVFAWSDGRWNLRTPSAPKVFKERWYFCVCWDDETNQFVVWGGDVSRRPSNDTLRLEKSGWRRAKGKSPKPADFSIRRTVPYSQHLVFDPLRRIVLRFSYTDVALLRGDVWDPIVPPGYDRARSDDAPVPLVDDATGEILLIDRGKRQISRFDYQMVKVLGSYESAPPERDPNVITTFMATSGRPALVSYGAAGCFELPLSAVAEQAAKRGPRNMYSLECPELLMS